jgi:tryptophanyl-tRNA synthetase
VAQEIETRGAAELKRRATEAVNEYLRPIRARRSELIQDRGYLRTIVRDGSAAARAIAQDTLKQVTAAMHTSY